MSMKYWISRIFNKFDDCVPPCEECEKRCSNCKYFHGGAENIPECKNCMYESNHVYIHKYCPECGRKLR